jgi:hypothetical protein
MTTEPTKSANQRWKESGTTLPFKEWIDRDNKKRQSEEEANSFIPAQLDTSASANFAGAGAVKIDAPVIDSVQNTLNESIQDIQEQAGFKQQPSDNTIFGLDKRILVFSSVLILGSLGYYLYKKRKAK